MPVANAFLFVGFVYIIPERQGTRGSDVALRELEMESKMFIGDFLDFASRSAWVN